MKMKVQDAIDQSLAADVVNSQGKVILPKGVKVTAPLAAALLKQGIEAVNVSADNQTSENEAEPTETDPYKDYINKLFARHRGQFMKELQQCLLSR